MPPDVHQASCIKFIQLFAHVTSHEGRFQSIRGQTRRRMPDLVEPCRYDVDENGTLSATEISQMLTKLKIHVSEADVARMVEEVGSTQHKC